MRKSLKMDQRGRAASKPCPKLNRTILSLNACKILIQSLVLLSVFLGNPSIARADKLIESKESIYNNIYIYDRSGLIVMKFGLNDRYWTESIYDPSDNKALPVRYTRYMTVSLAYLPEINSIAEVGFGGGRTAWYLHEYLPATKITSVELDGEVYELAKQYFGVREEKNFNVAIKDGRLFLRNTDETYDIIMIDAYRGPFVPFHLLTREFYQITKNRLNENGVIVQNVAPSTMLFDSALATISSVFENVDLYEAGANIVIVAYDGERKSREYLLNNGRRLQDQYGFKYKLPGMVGKRNVYNKSLTVEPLTDDFAPVEVLKAIERHNQSLEDLYEK